MMIRCGAVGRVPSLDRVPVLQASFVRHRAESASYTCRYGLKRRLDPVATRGTLRSPE
jgi:hypothetical protein